MYKIQEFGQLLNFVDKSPRELWPEAIKYRTQLRGCEGVLINRLWIEQVNSECAIRWQKVLKKIGFSCSSCPKKKKDPLFAGVTSLFSMVNKWCAITEYT